MQLYTIVVRQKTESIGQKNHPYRGNELSRHEEPPLDMGGSGEGMTRDIRATVHMGEEMYRQKSGCPIAVHSC